MLLAALTDLVPRRTGGRNESRIRSARSVTASGERTSSMRTANSSPPRRAAVSEVRSMSTDRRCNSPQELVPLAVAEGVVHCLEVVEVDEEHGQVGAGTGAASQGVIEPVLKERLVGEPGQRVMKGPVGELVFQELAVGDVSKAVDPSHDLPVDALGP